MSRTSRREFIATTAAGLLASRSRRTPRGSVTAQQVADRIHSNVGVEWRPQSVDGFKAGDPATVLTGIATAVLAIRGGLRMVGRPRLRVQTVYLAPGTTSLGMAIANLQKADAILAGEPREWEAIPYTLDTSSSDRGKGLISIGRMMSEGPGMAACAAWIHSLVPEIPVESIAVADPYWSPNA